jgi:predicted TIM-barrel fold metal-dependent hydrolase
MRDLVLKLTLTAALGLMGGATATWAASPTRQPVIDMHIHADTADSEGPPPQFICTPYPTWKPMDPGKGGGGVGAYVDSMFGAPDCPRKAKSALTDDELRVRTIEQLRKYDVYAIAGGSAQMVERWRQEDPQRILPAVGASSPDRLPSVEKLRRLHAEGKVTALMELTFQYQGIAPTDPRMEPYWALAEELDIPVGIHMGPGPPGTSYFATPAYRMALSDPLLLEPVLIAHPKLRVFVVHAGWPMKERMIALMYGHPQVYAEIGILAGVYRDADFYPYLKGLVDAGFEDRILYGSDQMVWPDLVGVGIERIKNAPVLTPAQKRKILYGNASHFLRIDPAGVMAARKP